jgi:hypothetical protein
MLGIVLAPMLVFFITNREKYISHTLSVFFPEISLRLAAVCNQLKLSFPLKKRPRWAQKLASQFNVAFKRVAQIPAVTSWAAAQDSGGVLFIEISRTTLIC